MHWILSYQYNIAGERGFYELFTPIYYMEHDEQSIGRIL
jgi:hypothetical protein